MKLDIMSLAAAALIIGVMLSSLGIEDAWSADQEPPSALQQGFAVR